MTTTESTLSLRDRVMAIAAELDQAGRTTDADDLRRIAGAEHQTMTPADAADVLQVTPQTVNRWLKQGVLLGDRVGDRGNWIVDAASVAACRSRRAEMLAARTAFRSGSDLDQAGYLAGLSTERIAALTEDD